MEIITPRLVLREFRESDFDAVWAYQSLPESNYYYDSAPSQEDEREDRMWNGAWSDAFVYSILDREWNVQTRQDR